VHDSTPFPRPFALNPQQRGTDPKHQVGATVLGNRSVDLDTQANRSSGNFSLRDRALLIRAELTVHGKQQLTGAVGWS
jgi:hypothetical protein